MPLGDASWHYAPATEEKGRAAEAAQNDALDSFVEAERRTLPGLLESGVYSDIQARAVYPGTVEFDYTYAAEVDPAAAAQQFDEMLPTIQSLCDTEVFPAMIARGVVDEPRVRFAYYNTDGSLIWEHTFARSAQLPASSAVTAAAKPSLLSIMMWCPQSGIAALRIERVCGRGGRRAWRSGEVGVGAFKIGSDQANRSPKAPTCLRVDAARARPGAPVPMRCSTSPDCMCSTCTTTRAGSWW